jgi:hypothetical protein
MPKTVRDAAKQAHKERVLAARQTSENAKANLAVEPELFDAAPAGKTISEAEIDRFASNFAANMFDYNASTYKMAQIQAMSMMTPAQAENYWLASKFPLSAKELQSLPAYGPLLVQSVEIEDKTGNSYLVDLSGELHPRDRGGAKAVNLRLRLLPDQNGQLKVDEISNLNN